jgi:uncharacterized protein YndB with AHSA1/START domain
MKGQLAVEARGETKAPASLVWGLVGDATKYAEWGPWSASGYEPPNVDDSSGAGTMRWMKLGRRRTVEKILEVEENRRMVYAVLQGIPVHNYRAEIVLSGIGGGTGVEWSATWDKTLLGRAIHRRIQRFYLEMVRALVIDADRRSSQNNVE